MILFSLYLRSDKKTNVFNSRSFVGDSVSFRSVVISHFIEGQKCTDADDITLQLPSNQTLDERITIKIPVDYCSGDL